MANKVLKTISVKWNWQGDMYMLKGFNIALMKNNANPVNGLNDVISYNSVDSHCYNPNNKKFEYTFTNITLDSGIKCTPWIQALFNNEDSEWVSLDGAIIEDDGNATIVVIGNPTFQQVIDMSKDSKITPQEKLQLKKEWDEITSDHFSIYAGITKANLNSEIQEVKAYISAANELAKYLNNNKIYYWHQINDQDYVYPEMIVDGLTTDLNTGHYVNVDTYREKLRLYYESKVQVLNLIQDTLLANNNDLIQAEIDKNTLPSTIPLGGYTSCEFTKNNPTPGCIGISIGSFSTTTGHKFNITSPQTITTSLTSNKYRTRFILFVGADYSRFQVTSSPTNNSNMFITATHKKGKWYYLDGANEEPKEFTPMPEDCVVAKVEEYDSTKQQNGIESIKFYASTSQSVFNALTDGGKLQGMFKDEDGRLFINAEFIQANSITADKMNIKGIKVVNSETGETTFEVTPNGEIHICANKFVLTAGSTTNVPTKDQVKDDIDNIKIGVRNIIKDGDISVTNTNYLIQTYYTHVPLATGKTYTMVFKGSIAEGQKFGIWYNGGMAGAWRLDRQPGSAIYVKTFTLTEELTKNYLSIYNSPQADGKSATIEWACLYEGAVKPPLNFVKSPEDIEIGGRNYITNSALKKDIDGFGIANTSQPGTIELVEFQGRPCIKFTDIGRWDVSKYLRTPSFHFPADEYMSFSMDVYITKGTRFYIDPDNVLESADFPLEIPKLNKWIRIGGTTAKKSTTDGDVSVAIYSDTETISGYLTLFKAETGTKPSGWSEAPEDTDAAINSKVPVGGSINDINQSPSGQIAYPKLNIRGAISFDDLASEIGQNFIAKTDSEGNRIQTVINGKAIEAGTVSADKMNMYNLNVVRRKMVNGKWQDIDASFSITDEGRIRASGTFSSFNFKNDTDVSKSEGWMISEDGDSVFNNSLIRGRVELPNAGITDSCAPDNEKIDLTKYCRNLLNTPLIVTNPADAIYASSGYPNPPVGMTINSYDQVNNKIKKGEASSNGNCWAIIAAVKAYNHINDTASKNKLKDIIVKSANFMVNNLSVGRFNSMNFKFVDTSYKYNATTKAWERGNYKEIYISSLWLQVRSLLLAFEMTGTTSYKDTALIILDSLYNMHIYINQKVINGELPSKLKGGSYDFLACDNLSSSNRFSPSKHFAHQIGFYLCQAIEEVIRIVGDSERTTPKGDKYKPSVIVDNYREYLEKAYNDGLTTSPTGLPYGCYYRTGESPNYEYVQGNWDFIDGTWGDSWFVGDVVCYTIYSYAKIGLKNIAKQYLDAYYNLRVDVNSSDWGSRFLGDLVFYDRLDFQGNHLADDNSVSITYTALFYEIARELGYEKYYNICARTLYKWQVKSSNKLIDGGYPWDVSKDGQTLELKSYGEIINSGCHKRLYLKNNEYVTNDNPVRIWAGTVFKDRDNAPYKVLQDGTIISTRGEFRGTVTGRLEIGNISIYDDLTTPGVIEIKNNDNSKTVVKIGEEYSEFNSDVFIGPKTNYMFRTNLANKQLVSGKESSIRFEYEKTDEYGDTFANSITIDGRRILFNKQDFISSPGTNRLEIGTEAPKGTLLIRSRHNSEVDGILGEMNVNIVGSLTMNQSLTVGNVEFVPKYPGLDIFVN